MMEINDIEHDFRSIFNLTPEARAIGYSRNDETDDDDDDMECWGPAIEDRNVFDVFDEFDDEE